MVLIDLAFSKAAQDGALRLIANVSIELLQININFPKKKKKNTTVLSLCVIIEDKPEWLFFHVP